MNGEATRFKEGNKAAEKWTLNEVEKVMDEMRDNAMEDKRILCLQDAIHSVSLYSSSLNYLIDKFPVFENIKKDIQDIITARINKGALEGDYQPTAAIWRMKQLGEIDSKEIKQKIDMSVKDPLKPFRDALSEGD